MASTHHRHHPNLSRGQRTPDIRHVWGELVPSKIFNPPFPVLKAGHSVSYSYIWDVCREWVNEVGFFLKVPVWLVYYAHVFHKLF